MESATAVVVIGVNKQPDQQTEIKRSAIRAKGSGITSSGMGTLVRLLCL